MTSDDDPFHDCELGPEAILGVHTSKDILFTDDTEAPVSMFTGEIPAHSQAAVKEAKEFATSIDTETPQITLPASVKTQIERQSKSYTSAASFRFRVIGSFERHCACHATYGSNTFTVDSEVDYEPGNLTVIVDRAGRS